MFKAYLNVFIGVFIGYIFTDNWYATCVSAFFLIVGGHCLINIILPPKEKRGGN